MKLIIGLGNIGPKYCFTRHNAGFMVIDRWAYVDNFSFKLDSKLKSFISKTRINDEDVFFVKPNTFMNLSGEAVRAVMDYYKIDISNIIVIYDDISMDIGKIRIRGNGSSGGHNGIKSIIKNLNSDEFKRIKVGIGPQVGLSEHFVLQNFTSEQLEIIKEVVDKTIEATKSLMTDGLEIAQNKFN